MFSVGVAAAALAIVALLFLPAVRGASSPHIGSPKAWARTGLLSVVIADMLLFAGHYVVYTYIGPYAIDAGLDAGMVSGALLVLGGTGVVGLWLAGMFVDRAPRQTLIASVAVMSVAFATMPFVHGSLIGTMVVAGVWMAANGTTGTLFMAAAIRAGGVSPDIAGALVNGASNIGIAGGAAFGGQALGIVGLQYLPFAGAAVLVGALGVVVLARRGFPVHSHAQEHLSTSSIEAITSSLAVVTTSVPVVGRAIQTVTGSIGVVTGSGAAAADALGAGAGGGRGRGRVRRVVTTCRWRGVGGGTNCRLAGRRATVRDPSAGTGGVLCDRGGGGRRVVRQRRRPAAGPRVVTTCRWWGVGGA
ncbi:hypothetical protein Q9Q99_03025 [Curtobacterium flaccumfaciens]|nr:hypothetical protein Q9Q99_03025 [Curtobacterium flaccumfaciens]